MAAAALFAASLVLPVATARQTQGLTTIMGYELLYMGPFGMLDGQFGWLATPCLIFAIVTALSRRSSSGPRVKAFVLIIMLLALADAVAWHDYPNDGGPGPLIAHGNGFFAWTAAVVLGALGLIVAIREAGPLRGGR
ncbi:hypothetical protein ASG11_05345 [Sphingomonas sp. Leaf357]|uniref:hypothetical protein n=1 Tax=Sphingomonas sp. Leaf357 TaxID=1736350 RepID=UPI0006FF21D6|nr:hypothetical protein [Sphingomonas sp. Leaf357]KQS03739.1 hypothetical protein ASG11_05345 [Sphingomonas sp. Leaf357]